MGTLHFLRTYSEYNARARTCVRALVRVCMRACVRVCVYVHVCACVRASLQAAGRPAGPVWVDGYRNVALLVAALVAGVWHVCVRACVRARVHLNGSGCGAARCSRGRCLAIQRKRTPATNDVSLSHITHTSSSSSSASASSSLRPPPPHHRWSLLNSRTAIREEALPCIDVLMRNDETKPGKRPSNYAVAAVGFAGILVLGE